MLLPICNVIPFLICDVLLEYLQKDTMLPMLPEYKYRSYDKEFQTLSVSRIIFVAHHQNGDIPNEVEAAS